MAYTTVDNPELFFQTKLFTGTGSGTQAVTLDGSENMQPDFVWTKDREADSSHDLYDSVRGVGKRIRSDANGAEATNSDMITAFSTDGFTVGTQDGVQYSTNDGVAWCWRMGTSFSNDASATSVGSIDSSGTISTTAGQSIISWTGTGSAATIAHGVGVVPKSIWVKNRDQNDDFYIYHVANGNTHSILLNSTGAKVGAYTDNWNNTTPTSSVFSVGGSHATSGGSSEKMIAYVFSDIKGYSKFGSYTGNGNADGPFVFLGFRPAFIMQKRTDSSSNWTIVDNKRDVDNIVNTQVIANGSGAEFSENVFDFLSNGFKIKAVHGGYLNASGGTYIYMAFAESPFVNSNGVPNNAR